MRHFKTGATRNTDEGKIDPEGALPPIVIKTYCEYIRQHRKQSDGSMRSDDNWQKGMPKSAFIKSGQRHNLDWRLEHRGYESRDGIISALCGLIFNAQGYLFEILKEKKNENDTS